MKPKKELYMGNPDSPFTMCYKKSRRHTLTDVRPFEAKDESGKTRKIILCRHCRQPAFKASE